MAPQACAVDADDLFIPVSVLHQSLLRERLTVVQIIDFSLFLNGTPTQKSAAARSILAGFQSAGFIYLIVCTCSSACVESCLLCCHGSRLQLSKRFQRLSITTKLTPYSRTIPYPSRQ